MKYIIETNRCWLRPFSTEDAKSFYDLNNNPKVTKYTGDHAFSSISDAIKFINNYNAYTKYGYGRWAVILKENQKFIGFCGLKYHEKIDITEVGYRFFEHYWNKGFATETAKGCIEYAFNTLNLDKLYCQMHKENKASEQVCRKLGFSFQEYFLDAGIPYKRFILENTSKNS